MEASEAEANYDFTSISDVQKKVLAILPIPSAILSIFGSSIIIYMAMQSRKSKPWTPYNRLLLAMSICDIVSSITLGVASFLYPKETSNKAWAFGNDASCSAIGFLNQISYAGTFYNGMLSFYFLFTARFALKNEHIQKRIEPLMHSVSLGFPISTAFVGLFLKVYAEPEVNIGCWVNRWPKLCGEGPDGTGEECRSPIIAWIFGAWIALFVLFALVVNNLIIWHFVHNQTKQRQRSKSSVVVPKAEEENSFSDEENNPNEKPVSTKSMASSFQTAPVRNTTPSQEAATTKSNLLDDRTQANQNRRLRLVSSQALLFVGCYFISNVWTYILRLFEAQTTDYVEEMELPYHHYHLLVLQAALLPLQGWFNMMVYIRPKYLKYRSEYPKESKLWAIRRSILGSSVKPLYAEATNAQDEEAKVKSKIILTNKKRREMVSSLTGHSNDDSTDQEGKHQDFSRKKILGQMSGASFENSLDAISERESESRSFPFQVAANTNAVEESQCEIGPGSASKPAKAPSHHVPTAGVFSPLPENSPQSHADLSIVRMQTGWSTSIDSGRTDGNSNEFGLSSHSKSDHNQGSVQGMMQGTGWSTSIDSIATDAPKQNSSATGIVNATNTGNQIGLPTSSSHSQELSMMHGTGWSTSIDSISSGLSSPAFIANQKGLSSVSSLSPTGAMSMMKNTEWNISTDSMIRAPDGSGNSHAEELAHATNSGRQMRVSGAAADFEASLSRMKGTVWSSSVESMANDSNNNGHRRYTVDLAADGTRNNRRNRSSSSNSQSTLSIMKGTGWSTSIDSISSDANMSARNLRGSSTDDDYPYRLKSTGQRLDALGEDDAENVTMITMDGSLRSPVPKGKKPVL